MAKSELMPRAKLLQIGWCSYPHKICRGWLRWKPFWYRRMANVLQFWIGPVSVTIRWWWSKNAAYSVGWDACWREQNLKQ